MSKPGITVSSRVGTSGSTRLRSRVITASARILPARMNGMPLIEVRRRDRDMAGNQIGVAAGTLR